MLFTVGGWARTQPERRMNLHEVFLSGEKLNSTEASRDDTSENTQKEETLRHEKEIRSIEICLDKEESNFKLKKNSFICNALVNTSKMTVDTEVVLFLFSI